MKLVLIGVVVLVLLGGGGFAGWWFLLADQEAATATEQTVFSDEPQFLALKPIDVPVMEGDQVTHRIIFELTLDLLPEHSARKARKHMPKIQDSIYSELHSLFGMRYVRDLDNILPLVKRRVREAANRALGGNAVGAVLVSNILKKRSPQRPKYRAAARDQAGSGKRKLAP